jgi:hypothetical protein
MLLSFLDLPHLLSAVTANVQTLKLEMEAIAY